MLYKTFKRWWRLYFTIKVSSAIDYTEGKQGDRRYHWFHVGVDKRPLGDDYVMSRLTLVLPWVAFGVGIVPQMPRCATFVKKSRVLIRT